MDNTTFRVGLAGLSRADARYLLPALAWLDGRQAELVAVADAEAGRAQAHLGMLDTTAGRRTGFADGHVVSGFALDTVNVHEDAEAMVRQDDLNAVVIAGIDRPAALADLALRCGRDVLLLAPEALADPQALLYLSDVARGTGRTFWPAHPSGLIRPAAVLALALESFGSLTGARATWNLARSSRAEPADAAQLLALTAPLAALLDAGPTAHAEVMVAGHGTERTVRAGWDTARGARAEAEVRLGWPLGSRDQAWITLHGAGGAQADLPLVAPGADAEPAPRTLRGVLWHPAHGPIPLPPRKPAATHRALVSDWVEACRAQRPERAPLDVALVAAHLTADLAAALRQDG